MADISELTELMNTAVELKRGGLYVVQCDMVLTRRQRDMLLDWAKRIKVKHNVDFIVLDGVLKLVTRPQEFEEAAP